MRKSRTLSVSIRRTPYEVYDFVSNLKNLSQWARTFCLSIEKEAGDDWRIRTPQGPMKIRMAEKNKWGVLDHCVIVEGGAEVLVPMRVVPNGDGSEVVFTLFQQSWMTEESFAQDVEWVAQDLKSLKACLEQAGQRPDKR